MNGPKIVCIACEMVEVSIAVPVCTDCLNEMIHRREHVPFHWCWCEPTIDERDSSVIVHREIQ
jgi:hypothetical protein